MCLMYFILVLDKVLTGVGYLKIKFFTNILKIILKGTLMSKKINAYPSNRHSAHVTDNAQ